VSVPDTASVIGDPSRIRQILRNLISNAIRHGGAEVTIRASDSNDTTTISVRDSGTALDRDEWESVFDPYYRSHSQPGQPDSVGLGLTVSRRLARAMAEISFIAAATTPVNSSFCFLQPGLSKHRMQTKAPQPRLQLA